MPGSGLLWVLHPLIASGNPLLSADRWEKERRVLWSYQARAGHRQWPECGPSGSCLHRRLDSAVLGWGWRGGGSRKLPPWDSPLHSRIQAPWVFIEQLLGARPCLQLRGPQGRVAGGRSLSGDPSCGSCANSGRPSRGGAEGSACVLRGGCPGSAEKPLSTCGVGDRWASVTLQGPPPNAEQRPHDVGRLSGRVWSEVSGQKQQPGCLRSAGTRCRRREATRVVLLEGPPCPPSSGWLSGRGVRLPAASPALMVAH